MNLNNLVRGAIGSVNPDILLTIQISTGSTRNAAGLPSPSYATPGALTGSIAGDVLTVTAIPSGVLMRNQTLQDTGALLPNTIITGQLSGTKGGIGTYSVNQAQTVGSEPMTTILTAMGQVQPITWRDIQQLDGLSLNGTRKRIYINGFIEGLVRATNKGGDLITIASGPFVGVWLVAQVLEAFPAWTAVAATLQDGS